MYVHRPGAVWSISESELPESLAIFLKLTERSYGSLNNQRAFGDGGAANTWSDGESMVCDLSEFIVNDTRSLIWTARQSTLVFLLLGWIERRVDFRLQCKQLNYLVQQDNFLPFPGIGGKLLFGSKNVNFTNSMLQAFYLGEFINCL